HQPATVSAYHRLLVDKELADEVRTFFRVEIGGEVARGAAAKRVLSLVLALPFRAPQIVDRSHLLRLHMVLVDEDEAFDIAKQHQNILLAGIDEMRLAKLPFRI